MKKAADRVDEAESEIHALQKDYEEKVSFFNERNEKGLLDIHNINMYYEFFSRINGRIDEQKKIHARCQNDLTCIKENLVSAHKEKKVFEILDEKGMNADKKEKSLTEQKEHDFIAISRRMK